MCFTDMNLTYPKKLNVAMIVNIASGFQYPTGHTHKWGLAQFSYPKFYLKKGEDGL